MRINTLNERLNHTMDTISYFFDNEYQYYKNYNRYPFIVDGMEYISLYRRLNVQFLVTKRCPYNCPFCIEKENPVGGKYEQEKRQLESLTVVLKAMKENGIAPTVSITGGEPILKPELVERVMKYLDELDVPYNINTSGYLKCEKDLSVLNKAKRINLSVHSSNEMINAEVFQRTPSLYWLEPVFDLATIQKVFTDASECRYPFVSDFISKFPQDRFSLRFPTDDIDVGTLDWKELFRSLEENGATFIQQKIGDYYWYEDWTCKGKHLHISFSSLKQLRKNQAQDNGYVRAVIIEPDGTIKYDWI